MRTDGYLQSAPQEKPSEIKHLSVDCKDNSDDRDADDEHC